MGSRGGRAPNPYRQHQLSTLFLRVPVVDWTRVKIGEKTEFRTRPGEGSGLLRIYTPTPVVAYSIGIGPLRAFDQRLMMLEEKRMEPLWAIHDDAEALAREGFETYQLFQRYWRARRKGVYRPMEKVWVWRVREFAASADSEPESADEIAAGVAMLRHLYGEHLP